MAIAAEQLAPDVTLLSATAAAPSRPGDQPRGYRRCYRLQLQPGECLLQRVRVHARYRQGNRCVADFRQTYYEFFAAPHDADRPTHAIDVHDFDVLRDGWRQAVIVGLLRDGRPGALALPPGEATLVVKKQFVLGPGRVLTDAGHADDAAGEPVDGGARFGLLLRGPGGASRARLRLRGRDGDWRDAATPAATPPGHVVAGTGIFLAARGVRAFEHFLYRYATQTGSFSDNGGYRPGVLE